MQLVGSAEAMEAYSRIKKFMTSDELETFADLTSHTVMDEDGEGAGE